MMTMFSKELEILDRNTVKLMIDEMGEELAAEKTRADEAESRADEAESRADEAESRADEAEKEIERLKKELERIKNNQA